MKLQPSLSPDTISDSLDGDRPALPRAALRAGLIPLYARLALGAAFLSAVSSRLGLWGDGTWDGFLRYAGEVNSFMPAAIRPSLACAATVAELSLGLALVIGFQVRWAALGSAVLLAVFGTAMAISFGMRSPLDYSVYSASACALLLARDSAARPRRAGPRPIGAR